jgi:hypothetical protein
VIIHGVKFMRSIAVATAIANMVRVRQLYAGNFHPLAWPRFPSLLRWWEWGKLIGAVGLVALVVSLAAGYTPHAAVVAVILHFAVDFTFQSPEMALRKVERGRHLLLHALVAGGLPLVVAGLLTGNPATALVWMVTGVVSHYAVDWTRRFGVRHVGLAVVLDQACHLLTILVLVLAY